MEKYSPDFLTCSGPSMFPTIKNGDAFKLNKYADYKEYKIGDIICYPHPEQPVDVVHRIIKIKPEGVVTRGDNNNLTDPYITAFENIKGIVICVKRGKREIKVANGILGLIKHKIMLFRKSIWPIITIPVRVFSRIIIKSKLLFFIHPFLELSVIMVKSKGIQEEHLMLQKKVIGKRVENELWKIRFPYKLFINIEKIK